MSLDRQTIEETIKNKVVDIAEALGSDARNLHVEEVIPSTGLIDSAALIELLMWYENFYQIQLAEEEITIDNLGSIAAMATFVLRRKGLL